MFRNSRDFAKRLFKWENSAALATILVGAVGAFGVFDRLIARDSLLLGILCLMATQMMADRVGVLSDLQSTLKTDRRYQIQLRPRTDPAFLRFSEFAQNAREIFVAGHDLGFLAKADAFFIPAALARGVRIKLLISNPESGNDIGMMLNNHDERNQAGQPITHDHLASAADTLRTMRQFAATSSSGSLEVRARVDVPAPAITMIDPTTPLGRIRIEIKPYKNNHGRVPYFELDRSSEWYEVFLDRYYHRLWDDSTKLLEPGFAPSPQDKQSKQIIVAKRAIRDS